MITNKIARLLSMLLFGTASAAAHADYLYTFSLDQVVDNSVTYAAGSFSFEAPTLPEFGSTFPVAPTGVVDGALIASVSIDGIGGDSYNFSTQPAIFTNPIGTVDFLDFTINLSTPPSPGVYTTAIAGRCIQVDSNGCGVIDSGGSLTITPVALPAASWLLLSGLGVLCLLHLRKQTT